MRVPCGFDFLSGRLFASGVHPLPLGQTPIVGVPRSPTRAAEMRFMRRRCVECDGVAQNQKFGSFISVPGFAKIRPDPAVEKCLVRPRLEDPS